MKKYPVTFAIGGPKKEAQNMQNIVEWIDKLIRDSLTWSAPCYNNKHIRKAIRNYVWSKKMLFLKQNLIGKMLTLDEMGELATSGAFEHTRHNGSFVFDIDRIIIYDDYLE